MALDISLLLFCLKLCLESIFKKIKVPPLGTSWTFSILYCPFPIKRLPLWWMFLCPFLQNAQWWNIHSLSKQFVPGHFQSQCSLLSLLLKTFVLQSIQTEIRKVALSSWILVLRRHKSIHNVREKGKQIGTAILYLTLTQHFPLNWFPRTFLKKDLTYNSFLMDGAGQATISVICTIPPSLHQRGGEENTSICLNTICFHT